MTTFVNVGALVHDKRPRTKKALRDALLVEPEQVSFDTTSPLGAVWGRIKAVDLTEDLVLTVAGPDPFEKRTWFASVRRHGDKFKVT